MSDRMLLVGCLRQGALARDFRLDLDWLADAAWAYVSDLSGSSSPRPLGLAPRAA
ncbi:hypothetical protein [Streptomyces sp. G44]|uniref:hypothetical protein n=1 Tax=Streptomyces sp. G44 TaxID=2807632 RepID=UPI001EF8FF01|nr:hypothetical protein [Streptomyces sp. G44]